MTDDATRPDPAPFPPRTEARTQRGRWPGLVWAIPLAAVAIVAFLGLRALAQQGVDVSITFSSADGVRPGDTKVIYQGIEAGRVTKVALNPDGRRVDLTVRLDPKVKPALRTSTRFWLVGAKPSLTDIASIKAALAGIVIGMSPGTTGDFTRRFIGSESPPAVTPGTPGHYYVVETDLVGPMRPGAALYYHGLEAGKVVSLQLVGPQLFNIGVFVDAPYDKLIHADTLFWSASPVQISLTGSVISTQFAPPAAAISGGVEFDTPLEVAGEPLSPEGSHFILYADRGKALAAMRGPQVTYDLAFKTASGDLEAGAPVKLGGFAIGAVKSVGMDFDAATGTVSTPITISIQPKRLHLRGVNSPADGNWRPTVDAALSKLFARGYRVRLSQSPPIIGARYVTLDPVQGVGPAKIAYGGPNPKLPTRSEGDISALTDKAAEILDKVDQVPIAEIGQDVRKMTSRLSQLLNSPQISDSIQHLDGTLNQVDAMLKEVKPQVGPLIGKLNSAADQLQQTAASANAVLSGDGAAQDSGLPGAVHELTDAARSIRSLTDYLGRHPEAILKGKVKEK